MKRYTPFEPAKIPGLSAKESPGDAYFGSYNAPANRVGSAATHLNSGNGNTSDNLSTNMSTN